MGLMSDVDLIGFVEQQANRIELRRKIADGEMSANDLEPGAMVDPYDAVLHVAESYGGLIFNNPDSGIEDSGKLPRENGEYTDNIKELNKQLNGLVDGLIAVCDRDPKKAISVALLMLLIEPRVLRSRDLTPRCYSSESSGKRT
jgi:hypothetical protein